MFKYKMSIGDKVEMIDFPTGYSDLTYGQFLRLRLEYEGEIGSLLEILTGVSRSIWMQLPESEYNKITQFLAWIVNDAMNWDQLQMPKALVVDGKEYVIPSDLGLETFGQKIVMEAKVSNIVDHMLKRPGRPTTQIAAEQMQVARAQSALISVLPFCVATYMQPRITNTPFNELEVPSIELQILNCRAVEVYPIGNFFIRNLLDSLKRGPIPSQPKPKNTKAGNYKKKPVSKKSKKKRGTS